jgi:hypothetical protein
MGNYLYYWFYMDGVEIADKWLWDYDVLEFVERLARNHGVSTDAIEYHGRG